jgi:phosphate transport system protein
MRSEFHHQLDELTGDVATMCDLAATLMNEATTGLLNSDQDAAQRVLSGLARLRGAYIAVERHSLLLLARQAPVARDLRAVVAAIQIAADADRMGGLAAHVARIARRDAPDPVLPPEVRGHFAEMGRIAVHLAEAARDVALADDPLQATVIREDDERMNQLHRELFTVVMDSEWRHGTAAAIDVVLLGRFYERFADHAVAIAGRVVFRSTGVAHV